MVKSELIERLAQRFPSLMKAEVEHSVNCMVEQMRKTLEHADRIEIRDFGTFSIRKREAIVGRNPMTGESVSIPARAFPHFKPGKQLRNRIIASQKTCNIQK